MKGLIKIDKYKKGKQLTISDLLQMDGRPVIVTVSDLMLSKDEIGTVNLKSDAFGNKGQYIITKSMDSWDLDAFNIESVNVETPRPQAFEYIRVYRGYEILRMLNDGELKEGDTLTDEYDFEYVVTETIKGLCLMFKEFIEFPNSLVLQFRLFTIRK